RYFRGERELDFGESPRRGPHMKPFLPTDEAGPETDELLPTKPLPPRTTVVPVQTTKRFAPAAAALVLLHPLPAGTRYSLFEESVTIGRNQKCGIVAEDDEVSSRHARFERRLDGTIQVVDLDSTNGTLVNGQPIKTRALRDGDLISLGSLIFRFQMS